MNKPIVKAEAAGIARVESGPVQFGSDWPGVFLRGDHAMKVAMCIRQLQKDISGTSAVDGWAFEFLAELATLIENEVDTRARKSD